MAAKTWSGEWWKIGGGAPVWNTVAYDPDMDIVYVGTGQPGPWTEVLRGQGDNLFCDSIIAVRGATGKLIWYHQEVPGDDWDFDSVSDLMLADLTMDRKLRQVIMHAPKNGFFYILDRRTGELLTAEPFVPVTWATGINLKTGRPTVNPEARYKNDNVSVIPSNLGATNWPPSSYNPGTGLVYLRSLMSGAYIFRADPDFKPSPVEIPPGERAHFNQGTSRGSGEVLTSLPTIGPQGQGNVLIAWDPIAQKERWGGLAGGYNHGGTLSTGGNVVFTVINSRLLACLSRRRRPTASRFRHRPVADGSTDDVHAGWYSVHCQPADLPVYRLAAAPPQHPRRVPTRQRVAGTRKVYVRLRRVRRICWC
jgi:quinohemoprotein ethanol dehydrogenase